MRNLRHLLSREQWVEPSSPSDAVCLAYPGSYGEASASLGYHFVLGLGRAPSTARAQRTFAPSLEPLMRAAGLASPLRAVESGRGAAGLKGLLFSVAWELQVPAVADMLRSAGLEPLRRKRSPRDPLVVIGGACGLGNPDLVLPLADVLVVGDGEEAMEVLARDFARGADRETILGSLAPLRGVVVAGEDPAGAGAAAAEGRVLPAASRYVTPRSVFKNMFLVEVMRGCPHACAFCLLGSKRLREKPLFFSARSILEAVPEWAARVGLVGASVLDHPEIDTVMEALASRSVELGLSSMRAARVTEERAGLLARGRVSTVTVAVDAPSERIGRRIRKPVRREDIVRAAKTIRAAGIRKMKLYALVGFEGEGDEDYRDLADLGRELSSIVRLTLSVGPVVPKRFTALAHMPLVARKEYRRCLGFLRRRLAGPVEIRAESYRTAEREYRLNRLDAAGAESLAEDGRTRP
jgi:radical SAM superfamily enzyme YgiQ (UPF0313 family)